MSQRLLDRIEYTLIRDSAGNEHVFNQLFTENPELLFRVNASGATKGLRFCVSGRKENK
jgi:hypothetical protein